MSNLYETRLAGLVTLALATLLTASAWAQAPNSPNIKTPPAKVSPVVESIVGAPPPSLEAPQIRAATHPAFRRHAARRRRHHHALGVARPALAGVVLVEPLRYIAAPPRKIVPMPAYFIDGVVADLTTPQPAVVCAHHPREYGRPDPRLCREVTLACAYEVD